MEKYSLLDVATLFLSLYNEATDSKDKQEKKETLIACQLAILEQAERAIKGMQIILYFSDEHKDKRHIENVKKIYDEVTKLFLENGIRKKI